MVSRSPENEKVLEVELEWLPVEGPDGKPYLYPDDYKRLRKAWSKPAVYRWVLSEPKRTLVGETGNLYGETGSVRRQREWTPHRNTQSLSMRSGDRGERRGWKTLKFERFTINGVIFDENNIGSFFIRRVLENISSELLRQEGYKLLSETPENREIRRKKREVAKFARGFGGTAEELLEAIRKVNDRHISKGSNLRC